MIVDKEDQDAWPTVGGMGKEKDTEQVISANNDTNSGKDNWNCEVTTFGDSLDAAIDGMDAAEEAAGCGSWDSAKWSGSEGSQKDSNTGSNNSVEGKDSDIKGNSQQTWSKTPGKGVKLKGNNNNQTEETSDSLSNSLDEANSDWKGPAANVDDEWKTVGKSSSKGTKNESSPEETGWGESSVGNRNSGSNWSASWSSQGLSLTGTEIWDQGSNNDDKKNNLNNDKGSDWSENSAESKSTGDSGWEGDGGEGWNRWTTASSKRNKVRLYQLSLPRIIRETPFHTRNEG